MLKNDKRHKRAAYPGFETSLQDISTIVRRCNMPIEGISDIRWLPRLNKIRLGIKKEGQHGPYPSPTDYFVCPEEVKAVYGERPTELDIMFPADNLNLVAPQWYKCYSYSQGMICKGDGKTCRRKVDVDTGDFASRDTREWVMTDGICGPTDCPMIESKQCRKMMSLLFILPQVPGLGVYQLDTSSFYSIVNINSQLAPDGFIRPFTRGKIAFIPLKLSIGPQEVNPPGVGRKTVQILKLRADVKLADIIRISRQAPAQVLLPTLEEEEPPDDLYPAELIGGDAETLDYVAEVTQQGGGEASPQEDEKIGKPATEPKLGETKVGTTVLSSPKESKLEKPTERAPQPTTSAPGEVGEGFSIDLQWLKDSQKALKWTNETMLSFIASQYKVSGKTVTEALNKLTREQAEGFTKQINSKVEKQQPKLI
jgi:hypothetical protein